MKQMNNMLFTAALLSLSLNSVFGQTAKKDTTLNRTVVVEKEYNPDIMDASKVNVLPKVKEPSITKKAIEYNLSLLPFTSLDYVMQPITQSLDQAKAKAGYARLGYGNNGNVDAKFSYLFNLSKRDNLGVSASLDGMNGTLKLPKIFETTYQGKDWKSRYYKTKLDVDYQHIFDKSIFDVAVNMGTDNFNYYQLNQTGLISSMPTDKQHHSKWSLHAGIKSNDKNLPLQFLAETNFLSFKQSYPDELTERIWRTKGDVYGMINEQQRVGIKAEMNNVFYTSEDYKNYSSVELNPYYAFSNESWKVRLGAHVDFSFGKGKSIQAAPDLEAQYLFSKSYVAYMKIGGGRELNDFRRLESLNPYIYFQPFNDSYNQLDAILGLKANVGEGFWFDVFSGYSVVTDDLCFFNLNSNASGIAKPYAETADTKHFYVGSNLKYSKGIADLSLKGTYYSWKDSNAAFMLMKPKFDLQFNADIKVLPQLTIDAGYWYISRNNVETYSYSKLDPINDLSLGATYSLFRGVSIFARIDNLLNQTYQYNYSYLAQGINFLGGLSFQF